MLTCEKCQYREFDAPEGEYRTHKHPCPHAWWDDEYGSWREAKNFEGEGWPPACFVFELDPKSTVGEDHGRRAVR